MNKLIKYCIFLILWGAFLNSLVSIAHGGFGDSPWSASHEIPSTSGGTQQTSTGIWGTIGTGLSGWFHMFCF